MDEKYSTLHDFVVIKQAWFPTDALFPAFSSINHQKSGYYISESYVVYIFSNNMRKREMERKSYYVWFQVQVNNFETYLVKIV